MKQLRSFTAPINCLALLLSLGLLVACGRSPSQNAATDSAVQNPSSQTGSSAVAPATGTPASPAAAAPVSPSALTAAATTEQESAGPATTDRSDSSLENVAALPAQAQLPGGNWVAGTNYQVLSPAQPTAAPAGQVEVIEVFWYGCPHCYALDPYLQSWAKSKASYIDFVRVPIMWDDIHRSHARLFYTLQALGKLDELHSKVFDEIHQRGDELYVSNDPQATLAAQLKFAEANGISAAAFTKAYNSFGVQTDLQKADELDRRYRIDSVPTIVIDGKYETDVEQAGGTDKLIELINSLAASEKRIIG
jgi:thiol:disulfide interchange protein DsbA